MFGEGTSVTDLLSLVTAIRKKDLVLEVKILEGPWEPFTPVTVRAIVQAIEQEKIKDGKDIRLRLHAKESTAKS